MSNLVAPAFWVSLPAAGCAAFLLPAPFHWVPIAWLGLVGAVFSAANWGVVVLRILGKKPGSSLPLVGGVSLVVAMSATPLSPIRHWAALGLLVDPWFVGTLIGTAILTIRGYRRKDGAARRRNE